MSGPVFSVGDVVRCVLPHMYRLTYGKEYKIEEFDPPMECGNGLVLPAYVRITDDLGKRCYARANRFTKS